MGGMSCANGASYSSQAGSVPVPVGTVAFCARVHCAYAAASTVRSRSVAAMPRGVSSAVGVEEECSLNSQRGEKRLRVIGQHAEAGGLAAKKKIAGDCLGGRAAAPTDAASIEYGAQAAVTRRARRC